MLNPGGPALFRAKPLFVSLLEVLFREWAVAGVRTLTPFILAIRLVQGHYNILRRNLASTNQAKPQAVV